MGAFETDYKRLTPFFGLSITLEWWKFYVSILFCLTFSEHILPKSPLRISDLDEMFYDLSWFEQ
jgi:hypothetical protein